MTVALAGLAVLGCGDAPSPAQLLLRGAPTGYVARLDDMPQPGFAVDRAAATATAADLAAGDAAMVRELGADGMEAGAQASYFRIVPALATANGPIEVISSAIRFGSLTGAVRAYSAAVQRRDGVAGARAESTGRLGDDAHADTLVVAGPRSVQLVQETVTFRVENVLNTVVVRGRLGGTRLEDALIVARHQAARQGR